MIWLSSERLLFLQVPRCASTSIGSALVAMGAERIGHRHMAPHDATPEQIDAVGHYVRRARVVLVVVREHVDWWRSFYDFWRRDPGSEVTIEWILEKQATSKWSAWKRWHNGSRFLFGRYTQYATRIVQYERLAEDLPDLLPGIVLPELNRSSRTSVVPDKTAKWIRHYYRLERQMLGYE